MIKSFKYSYTSTVFALAKYFVPGEQLSNAECNLLLCATCCCTHCSDSLAVAEPMFCFVATSWQMKCILIREIISLHSFILGGTAHAAD